MSLTKYNDIYRLNVTSANRPNPDTTDPAQFNVNLGYPVRGVIIETHLMQAIIPNVFDAFTDLNDTLNFTDSGGPNTITIKHGTYKIDQFITELETKLNAVSADTYTVTFDDITLSLTITSSFAGFVLDFTNSNTPAYNMGWVRGTTTAAGAAQVSPNAIDLLSYKNIYLVITEFTRDFHNVGTGTFSYQIPITSCYGELNYYFPQSQSPQVHIYDLNNGSRTNLLNMTVALVDDTGRLVNLKGKNFEFTLEFKMN
jgi:hypothetical protein